MIPEISKALELYEEADNLAKDWLIKSWKLKDEDKEIAKLHYRKACKERKKLVIRLVDLTNGWKVKNTDFESVGSILARREYLFLKGDTKK